MKAALEQGEDEPTERLARDDGPSAGRRGELATGDTKLTGRDEHRGAGHAREEHEQDDLALGAHGEPARVGGGLADRLHGHVHAGDRRTPSPRRGQGGVERDAVRRGREPGGPHQRGLAGDGAVDGRADDARDVLRLGDDLDLGLPPARIDGVVAGWDREADLDEAPLDGVPEVGRRVVPPDLRAGARSSEGRRSGRPRAALPSSSTTPTRAAFMPP